MLATIMLDTFSSDEREAIADALDVLCSPNDNYAFSCTGVYVFWSVPDREIMYIGLASNVGRRVRQHLGLIDCDAKSCKCKEIDRYFTNQQLLGCAFVVQSKLTQVLSRKEQDVVWSASDEDAVEKYEKDMFGARENIVVAEGGFIELFYRLSSRLPAWNKVHGSNRGRKRVTNKLVETCQLLSSLSGVALSELNARATLREIANNATYCEHELFLHGARMQVVSLGRSLDEAIADLVRMNADGGRVEALAEDGYMSRTPRLQGVD
jgi:hypothetical protein